MYLMKRLFREAKKFMRGDEDAVSPVIGVILMVAVTVALVAVVYVWLSGFLSPNAAPVSMQVTQIQSSDVANNYVNFSVASVSTTTAEWTEMEMRIDGTLIGNGGNLTGVPSSQWYYTDDGDGYVDPGEQIRVHSATAVAQGANIVVNYAPSQSQAVTITIS